MKLAPLFSHRLRLLVGFLFSPALSFVRAIKIGRSDKQVWMFVEILPREIANVVRHPFDKVSDICRHEDNAIGFESLNDAIINAESIGARILGYVEPENLLFIFSQSLQSLRDVLLHFPLPQAVFNHVGNPIHEANASKRDGTDEHNAESRAIVLCKLSKSASFQECVWPEEKHACDKPKCYQITWRELQTLKNQFSDFSNHVLKPNVPAPFRADANQKLSKQEKPNAEENR
jgi:hypothetical protein